MPNADEIARSIEPGSLEYGDRQVVADRIQQAQVQKSGPTTSLGQGQAMQATQGRLSQGPVSDKPVTSGLSVGPGSGPMDAQDPANSPKAEQYRLLAANARNPYLRKIARNALKAHINRGS